MNIDTVQAIKSLKEDGYTMITGVLSKNSCLEYVKVLEKIYAEDSPKYASSNNSASLADKSFEKVVFNLHNKSGDWMKILDHEIIHEIVGPVLKDGSYKNSEPFYMYNSSARNPLKGNPGQQIHVDSNLPGINYPLVVNALWYLEDSNEENGATIVIPDTMKTMQFAEDGKIDYPNKVIVEAKAGDVLLFNANIWHGGGANLNGKSRWAAAVGYARWFIKPSFDTIRNTPMELYKRLTDRQKRLLGFDSNPPLNEFERLNRRAASPEEPRI